MIIEIRKVGFLNKGAELMLRSILERLRARYPEAIITMVPSVGRGPRPFRKIVEAGLYPKCGLYRYGKEWGTIGRLAPQKLREMYGIILDQEIDVVIDAAGFSYGDQWGARSTEELSRCTKRWRKQGTKVILMPQAFGPYSNKSIRKAIKHAVRNADLVMPRDSVSCSHLLDATGRLEQIKQYPDFTNLTQGVVPNYFDDKVHRVCIVPNYRMVEKSNATDGLAYLPFMQKCAEYLLHAGAQPFILVHEGKKDEWLAEQISSFCGCVPIISEPDPLKIKGIIGASYVVIGSRFHALVSALSQGVPCLGTSWSHKYIELFRDYKYVEGVIGLDAPWAEVLKKIQPIIEPKRNSAMRSMLSIESKRYKNLSTQMWNEVFSVIEC